MRNEQLSTKINSKSIFHPSSSLLRSKGDYSRTISIHTLSPHSFLFITVKDIGKIKIDLYELCCHVLPSISISYITIQAVLVNDVNNSHTQCEQFLCFWRLFPFFSPSHSFPSISAMVVTSIALSQVKFKAIDKYNFVMGKFL